MASDELVLRCQFQGGKRHTIKGLVQNSSVKELKEKIFCLTDVPCHAQRMLLGFPPKEMNFKDVNAALSSTGIRSGDTLIIERKKQVERAAKASQHSEKLSRKIVPADNSCLFASISYVILGDTCFSGELRDLIVKTVSTDPVTYNQGFLGMSNEEYCRWIADPERWGGAIEISILCKHYETEIDVVNTETGRIDRFGEDENYLKRVFLIYDGIHYDPLGLITLDGAPIQTLFDCKDDIWITAAMALGEEARKMSQFTNLTKFKLRCLACNLPLTGQSAALQHAKDTNHTNFGEV